MLVDNINNAMEVGNGGEFFIRQMERVVSAAITWKEIDEDTRSNTVEIEMAYDSLREAIENYELMLENKETV